MKYSYAFQLNYEITAEEKAHAEKALQAFDFAAKVLKRADKHLDILYIPYKDHPQIPESELIQYRAALRRFRDKVIENFNAFKRAAFKCIQLMQFFSSDTQSSKLIRSIISTVETIEGNVNKFSDLFSNLEDKEFVAEIVKIIELIKHDTEQLEEIIDERIKAHILTDILGKTWVNSMQDEMKINIENKVPLLIELNEERQKTLNNLKKIDK